MKLRSNDKPAVPFSLPRAILSVNDDDDLLCFATEWLLSGCYLCVTSLGRSIVDV